LRAEPEAKQEVRRQQRDMVAGGTIDHYEVALPDILDPRGVEGSTGETLYPKVHRKRAGGAKSTADGPTTCASLLRQAGLAQADEIGGLEQGAGLRDTPISVGHYLGDARKRTCAQQPAGLGKFSAGPLGLAF
jgi:hypothetical protein